MPINLSKKYFFILFFLVLGSTLVPETSSAQILESNQNDQGDSQETTYRGKVLNVLSEEMLEIPGTGTDHLYQQLEVKILDGSNKGDLLIFENDYIELDVGDKFFFKETFYDGQQRYEVINIDRKGALFFLFLVFVTTIIVFGRWQGVRSLIALAVSFLAIIFILLPGILNGWNPLLASVVVAGGILFGAIFFTHGFNRESAVAYSGTMIAVLLAGLFAVFAVHITDLSGFASDETVYLNFGTNGTLNFTALLLGAFIIGFLGVLDDIAVTQSAVVSELFQSNPDMSRKEIYHRAMRVGREHVGALVNTLVLAYTGASLPLLLFFTIESSSFAHAVNLEIFATEIVRIIVGSIGLILTVPIVTFLAVKYLKGYKSKNSHSHAHGHTHNHHM